MRLLVLPRSNLKRASKAADPNLCMWVKFLILPLARCMTVLVDINDNAARSVMH